MLNIKFESTYKVYTRETSYHAVMTTSDGYETIISNDDIATLADLVYMHWFRNGKCAINFDEIHGVEAKDAEHLTSQMIEILARLLAF